MPIADASIGLPGTRPNGFHQTALHIEHSNSLLRILLALAGVDRLCLAAVALGIGVVEMRHQTVAIIFERQGAVNVKQIGLIVVYQVAHARIPMFLPPFRNAAFIPIQLAVNFVRIDIEAEIFRVGTVIRHARQGAGTIRAVADGKPFVSDPQMIAHAELQAFFRGGLMPQTDNVFLRPHIHGIPLVVFGIPHVEIVVVDAHGEEVFGAGLLVEVHEVFGVPLVGGE